MSVEVKGLNFEDDDSVHAAKLVAARFCIAHGFSVGETYTDLLVSAEYSGQIIFTALREMGIIPEEGIDNQLFERTAKSIMNRSNVPAVSKD